MTLQEAQLLLDSMLMPFSIHKERIQANNTLSDSEKGLLLQIVIDFEAQSEKYDYKRALADIATIMNRYVKAAEEETEEGTKYVVQPDALPFLIHQVLFFIAVSCNVYDSMASQNEILVELGKNGVTVSHNFFSRMYTTPTQYVSMRKYKQPELVTNYMGQKHGELSVAIKNLVYQAGKYDIFCDIFGGSGAALLSVDRRKEANYVYNELNRSVRNLFEVLVDDKKHLELIEELEALQKDLRGDGPWLESVDFEQEVQSFISSMSQVYGRHLEVLLDGSSDLEMEYEDIVEWMRDLKEDVLSKPDNLMFSFDGKTYDKQYLLNEVFKDSLNPAQTDGYDLFMSYCKNKQLIMAYWDHTFANFRVPDLSGTYYSELDKEFKKESQFNTEKRHMQYRFYMYYAYFMNLLNKSGTLTPGDMVRYAVAELYRQSFTTSGKMGLSSILRMNVDGYWGEGTGSNDAGNFLAKDFGKIISNIHKTARGTICEGLDCIDVIEKYQHSSQAAVVKHNNPIFYSDSPYSETSDYTDKNNGVSAFDSSKMKALIDALKNSEDRFIFSCRAVKGSVNGSKTTDKLKKSNNQLKNNVFDNFNKEFIKNGRPLWVLAIEKKDSLEDLIKNNKVVEIMITNFEIANFLSDDKCCKDVTFNVYRFTDFMSIWSQNANV